MRPWARNVPLPEPHLVGLAVGVVAGRVVRWTLPLPAAMRIAGLGLTIVGMTLVSSAIWASRDTYLALPDKLVIRGPYAVSRNPMYAGWTMAYLGVAAALASGWLLVLAPVVLVGTHIAVRREERRLLARFGPAYTAYAATVRRYV